MGFGSMTAPGGFVLDEENPVNWDHPLNRGLASRWMVLPGTGYYGGLTLRDLCFTRNIRQNGTLTNGPQWVGPIGTQMGAILFDGSNDYVNCGSIPALDGTVEASFGFWGYRAGTSNLVVTGTGTISTSNRTNIIWFSDGNIYYQICNGNNAQYSSAALAGTGWHHVFVVFNGALAGNARVAAYIDGVAQSLTYNATPPATLASIANQGTFDIGREGSLSRYTTGMQNDCRIFRRALSAAEVNAMYLDTFVSKTNTLNWISNKVYSFPGAPVVQAAAGVFMRMVPGGHVSISQGVGRKV